MRTSLFALALVPALTIAAQQPAAPLPPAGSNWQHVQVLPVGTSLNIKARTTHTGCKLKSVDADSLTCTQGKDLVFQRADILAIQVPHRGRSTLVGLGIGAGLGAIVGKVSARGPCNNLCIISPGTVVTIGAIGFGAVGTAVGALTDFTRATIYKAP